MWTISNLEDLKRFSFELLAFLKDEFWGFPKKSSADRTRDRAQL